MRDDPSHRVLLFRGETRESRLAPQELASVLNAEERARADRFVFERDRRRYTVTTAYLRLLLATLLEREPASLRFTYNAHGKPALEDGPTFNLSHSGGLFLIGVAEGGRLGVDIEVVRPVRDLEALATRNFSSDEVRQLLDFPPPERERAFFRAWTRKESFLKALGGGLTIPLDSFCVSLEEGTHPALLSVDDQSENPSGWSLRSVVCDRGAEAAIAWDRPALEIEWLDRL